MAKRTRREMTPLFVPEWSATRSRVDDTTISIEQYSPEIAQSGLLLDSRKEEELREQEDVENDLSFSLFDNDDSNRSMQHLLKSGALGKCDDPYCTTCPSYFGFGTNEDTEVSTYQQQGSKTLFGRAKLYISNAIERSKGIFHPHTKRVQRWNQIFAVSCLLSVFIDPLFFLILSVKQDAFCISFNANFATFVTILRSITDGIYLLHMLLQFRLAYFAPASRTSRAGDLVDDPKTIVLHYCKGWFPIDFVAVLPIPQMMLWFLIKRSKGEKASANYVKNLLRVVVLLQYVPRMVRILPMLFRGTHRRLVFETAWANFTINLFIYLLASHVVGCCWYLFGLQRVNQCLRDTCDREKPLCSRSYLDCGNGEYRNPLSPNLKWTLESNASSNCLVNATFNYGIYYPAIPLTMQKSTLLKYVYSLCWGFLQMSTLGGNLVPSYFPGEVLFTMGITGLGLLLFALLIGNMQNFLQSLGGRQLQMQLRRRDVESWMNRRRLPPGLQSRVRQAVRLKWASTRGINEEQVLERLPEDLQKEIRRHLCFFLVKKVRIFTLMNEQVLDAICERLHQMLYIESSYIFHCDAPLHRMLFIVGGSLESLGKDGSRIQLNPGDFCGEELLIWCLEHTVQASKHTLSNMMRSLGGKAVSTRTVRCLTSVEAFSLEAKDIQYVAEHFARFMRNSRVQGAIRYMSPFFRGLAAQRIQAAWKSYKRRKLASSVDLIRFSSSDTF